ncbi:MAG: hypothetical protein GY716_14855 [bacterium]|nr:hypothetical protein [bacterium]
MTPKTKCRRRTRRLAISKADGAWLSFESPGGGDPYARFPVVDLSVSGLSFRAGEDCPGIESGGPINGVVLEVGDCKMSGDLLIMHVTPLAGAELHCGALFYPAADADLIKLKSILAGIEAASGA